jgi:small subunit ribosomal protein S20
LAKSTSAERAARTAESKRQQNRSVKSHSKSATIKAEELIASGDRAKAQTAVTEAISRLDKSVKTKILHLNTASRRKANLMKHFNKAFGKESPPTEAKPARKKPAAKKLAPAKTKEE